MVEKMATSLSSLSSSARERPQHLQAGTQGLQQGPDTRRKHRKYRYRGQGYHKNERESARRVEAKRFLSGITLDSHLRPPSEALDKETALKQHGSASSIVEELVKSNPDLPNSEKLHEMAASLYDFYSHHSPVKMALSRSHELFDGSPYNPSTPVSRSVSVVESTPGAIVSYEQRKASLHHMPHSKSLGFPTEGGPIHCYGNFKKFPLVPLDNKYVKCSHWGGGWNSSQDFRKC